jgi:hypothetical protein
MQYALEDGKYYMWVAEMTDHCSLGDWRTNSEVALAVSQLGPLGPFEKLANLILPWAHNPQVIVSPDTSARFTLCTRSATVLQPRLKPGSLLIELLELTRVLVAAAGFPVSGTPINCSKLGSGDRRGEGYRGDPAARLT